MHSLTGPFKHTYSQANQTALATITLEQFHSLLADACAVCANDTLYFVGYNTDNNPYIADSDGQDYVDLSTVDGDIEVGDCAASFWVQGNPIRMTFLNTKDLSKRAFCID
jgi:hypothetical protein